MNSTFVMNLEHGLIDIGAYNELTDVFVASAKPSPLCGMVTMYDGPWQAHRKTRLKAIVDDFIDEMLAEIPDEPSEDDLQVQDCTPTTNLEASTSEVEYRLVETIPSKRPDRAPLTFISVNGKTGV